MRLIETTHLEGWAGSRPAGGEFPHVVKGLICAVIQPDKLRMPSGDAVWVPGFDGVLFNSEKNRFVPMGLSVWELGTTSDIKGKANEDYEKRSRDKAEEGEEGKPARKLDRTGIAFVFVTPRVWKDKDAWVAERKAEQCWQDVVAIDGVDLQDWLEAAPAVSLQFAAVQGLVPEEGLQPPDLAWEEWSHLTDPPVSEELVIVGREGQEKELAARLISSPGTFTVRGDSPREAWGFTLASLRRIASEDERLSLHARTIVADNEEVAGRLKHLRNLIIVLKQTKGQVSGALSSRGFHVIVPEGNDAHSERNVIVLARPTHRVFAEALVRMGLSDDEAERETRACGFSVTILQRLRAHANYESPRWSANENVVHLLPALLAGRWSNQSEADREILRRLAGATDYASVENQLQQFLWVDEPPLRQIGEMWTLTAPVDAFQLMARRLTRANLDCFKSVFRDVFGRIDPKVEIPLDEWIYYDIKGEQGHSGWLRSGMAESLLLIAERGIHAHLDCGPPPHAYAEEVVRELPGLNDDWRVLASLRDQYPRLVEAAPLPLLDSLERLLGARPDDVSRLFAEGERLGAGSMHTGLLWGLETLAWSPEYLPRIGLILARLASLHPGGRLSNRPINSLGGIFVWWHPGTNAALEQRLAVIDLILDREPVVGWAVLAKLLPDARLSMSLGTARPRWRDFGDLPEEARTRRGQTRYVAGVVDRALGRVGRDPERWRAILGSLRGFSATQKERALSLLDAIAPGPVPVEEKTALWEVLRDFAHQHRAFQDADWALTGDLVDQLEAILARLAPENPIERNRWLFDDWLPDLPAKGEDTERHQEQIEELRRQAVRDIMEVHGVQGVVELGTLCGYPGFVAAAAVPLMPGLAGIREFAHHAIAAGEAGVGFAGQISAQAQKLHGEPWRALVCEEATAGTWPPAVTAALLVWWPDGAATWEDVDALGVEVAMAYWRRKRVFAIDGTPEEQTYQIEQLTKVGRAAEAFHRAATGGRGVPTGVLLRLFDATLEELSSMQTAEEFRRRGINSYDVRRYLDELRQRAEMPREELARREYRALPLLDYQSARGLTIHELMASDPGFFIDVLCDVFLPEHRDERDNVEPTPELRARAQAAYRLLEGMHHVPGQREDREIDEEALLEWAETVRAKAVEVDRAVMADLKIGQVLAHAPADPGDGGWPHEVVRSAIEKLGSEDIDRGMSVERFNMRGVHSRDLNEGGAQERALASQYRTWADLSRLRWPRVARVLAKIAQGWEDDARREDVEAEQMKVT